MAHGPVKVEAVWTGRIVVALAVPSRFLSLGSQRRRQDNFGPTMFASRGFHLFQSVPSLSPSQVHVKDTLLAAAWVVQAGSHCPMANQP